MTVDGRFPLPRRIRDDAPRPGERLTVGDAAGRVGVPVRFIRQVIAERRIRFYRTGWRVRIDGHDLDIDIDIDIDAHYDDVPGDREGNCRGRSRRSYRRTVDGGSSHDR